MPLNVIVGYDGSLGADAATDAGAVLLPGAHGWITYLWVPPFASDKVRRRLRSVASDVHELITMIEREGEREAQRLVDRGVVLARAVGWHADPLLKQTWGGEGLRISQAAEDKDADVVLVGSRGLGGTEAVLGSVSDNVMHYCSRPVLVVPHPMLEAEFAALSNGPVIVGWDASAGAERAFAAARSAFPKRELVLVSVDDGEAAASPSDMSSGGPADVVRIDVERSRGMHSRTTADALVTAARGRDAAVVVVGSRGRSTAREILLGSVALGVVHHSHRPVMVVPSEWQRPR